MLHGFCSAVEQRRQIPQPILDYLYLGFAAYLSTKVDPKDRPGRLERCLFLARGRGRPDGGKIRVKEGRIYTDVAIAGLFNLLLKGGIARPEALALLEDRNISPSRSTEQYAADNNSLADDDWTPVRLRQLVRDEREIAKSDLDPDQRQQVSQGIQKKRYRK